MSSADWLIVGGGAPALVSALYLRRQGAQVLVLDDNNPSASRAGAGILSPLPPWRAPPPVEQLAAAGAAATPALLDGLGDPCGYRRPGMRILPPHDDAALALWRKRGGQVDFAEDGALFLPHTAVLRPRQLIKALRRRVPRRIARVEQLVTAGDAVDFAALAGGERLRAENILLSAGAWSAALCPPPSPPIRPMRGQMLLFDPPGETMPEIRLQEDSGCYVVQREDGRVLAGSTLEDAGFDSRTTSDGRAWLRAQAAALFPALRGRRERAHWAGLRPAAALPIIARHPRLRNLYINSGHYRYGVTMAPAAAAHLLRVVKGEVGENPYAYPAG